MTLDVLHIFKVKCQTSSARQIVALFQQVSFAESNDNVKILIKSLEIAVYAHAQYKIR